MMKYVLFVVVLLFAWSGIAFADHPLVTDEAETLGKGGFEVELNTEFASNEEDDGVTVEEKEYELEAEFAYGITDDIEVYVEIPYLWVKEKSSTGTERENGMGDIETGLRWLFFEGDEVSLALKPFAVLPAGDEEKGLGNGRTSYGISFMASKELDSVALHMNIGYTRNEYKIDQVDDESRNNIFSASLAVGWRAADALRVVGNIGMETNQEKDADDHPAFVIAGAIYELTDNIAVDAGLKIGITDSEDDYAVLVGVSYEFEGNSGSDPERE